MTRASRSRILVALITALTLTVSACAATLPDAEPVPMLTGDPVQGGTLKAIQSSEPRTLDPATMAPGSVSQGLLGNALYGTLVAPDLEGNELRFHLAESLASTDGGSTFVLTLRPDLRFSNGKPLTADSVKFNWDRLRDPETASGSIRMAMQVAATEAIDARTLRVTLAAPNPHFPDAVIGSGMNWIADPEALRQGTEQFNKAPIGAGPYTLENWSRQDKIELVRNPHFWDAPRPYIDRIELRTMTDSNQRVNSITTGAADLSSENNWQAIAQARNSGHPVLTVPLSGGQFMAMNTRRAPFDDVRARRAVSLALDLEWVDLAAYNGRGEVPETLFLKTSPYFTETPLSKRDPEEAQRLFNELAAEGKPVSFSFISFPTLENKGTAESIQSQLSAFDNVDATVDMVDFPTGMARQGAFDFDMVISAANIQDPDTGLWPQFHSSSPGNISGIADPELDKALVDGRFATTLEERKAAYQRVQERIVALSPGIWYTRPAPTAMIGTDVGGVEIFGIGSVLPEKIWKKP